MTLIETILAGIILSLISILVGKLWGSYGKVTDEQCEERRISCGNLVCKDLITIKEDQKEMKVDIAEIKRFMYGISNAK